ncbi:hypothetical protein [Gordonia humi]|uniref:DUF5642 domain-containing protein n=1 Tax=Gordonia humi TaxID=686429 RepID=A0A840EX69_9ACTN|nr:hypothetical protein [Gordonia humi]
MTGVKAVVAIAAISLSVVACSVDGDAVRVPDLTGRIVDASAFPFGAATPVPAAQTANALADITFTPLRAENDPADCTPAPVDAADAQIRVGPGGAAGGTLTVALTRTSDSFGDHLDLLRRCADFALGGTVGTRVSTDVLATADDTVESARTLSNGGTPYTRVYELTAQRGHVRLYVQNRFPATAQLGDAERAATRTLFDTAYDTAFGR